MTVITELWKVVDEYPLYSISNHGRVMNNETDTIKIQTINQQGIPSVLVMLNGKQHRKSVAVLVATAFLRPPRQPHFNTPINLDGDRTNNHSTNLAWRPRWFAVKYHQQFTHPERRGFLTPIQDIETGRIFNTGWEAAVEFGLIDVDIMVSSVNGTYCFPTGQRFRMLDDE